MKQENKNVSGKFELSIDLFEQFFKDRDVSLRCGDICVMSTYKDIDTAIKVGDIKTVLGATRSDMPNRVWIDSLKK